MSLLRRFRRYCLLAVALLLTAQAAKAQTTSEVTASDPQPRSIVTNRITLTAPATAPATETTEESQPQPTQEAKVHPLDPVLKFALAEQTYLHNMLRNFTCRVVKRERLEGVLQEYQFLHLEVREELKQGDRIVQPLSVYIEYFAPSLIVGRRVLFVKGRFDNRMLVRKGGPRLSFVVIDIDPFGPSAKRESGVPITEVGFDSMLTRMIRLLEKHRQADPTGENTKVQRVSGAKVNKRLCTVIIIEHPNKQPNLDFHKARVFVDDQLHVPIRVDAYDWPDRPNEELPVIAEYTYTDVNLNVNLSDNNFEPARVRAPR